MIMPEQVGSKKDVYEEARYLYISAGKACLPKNDHTHAALSSNKKHSILAVCAADDSTKTFNIRQRAL
jgi:hypothetical protein